MTDIPKRPDWPCGDYGDAGPLLDHARAVAKVAVEQMQCALDNTNEKWTQIILREALAKIEASGWQP